MLNEGLERYPDNGSLRYSLALLYEDQGRNRKALDVLEALAEEHPDDAAILNAYGYLLTDEFDRHEQARDYIERALALNPDSAAIIDSMGWVLFKLGDYRAARDYLERAYRLEQEAEIAAHLVDVRWQLGERDSALELLRESLEANPDSRHLRRSTTVSRHDASRRAAALLAAARSQRARRCPSAPMGASLEERRELLESVDCLGDARPAHRRYGRPRVPGQIQLAPGDDALELVVREPLAHGVLQVAGRATR